MKFFNKQTLALAIVGALASSNALSANLIQTANTVYAKEIKMPVTGLSLNVAWKVGYNFNTNETRYACVRLEGAQPAAIVPTVTQADGITSASPTLTAGTVNANGNVAFFTLSSNPTGAIPSTAAYQVQLNNLLIDVASRDTTVTATVGLYDNPAAAGQCLAEGPANPQLIAGTGDTKKLLTFEPSYAFLTDPNKAIASVDNLNTPYAGFKNPVPAGGLVSPNANNAYLAKAQVNLLTYGTPATAPRGINGVPVTMATLFDTAATNVLTIDGDFGAWATAKTFATVAPTTSTATSASWNVNPTALNGNFAVVVNSSSANEIPAGGYIASLKAKANTGYTLNYNDANAGQMVTLSPKLDESIEAGADNQIEDIAYAEASAGQIVQDGVRLQAPLVQVPTGWLSRLVITNTGNKDRTFFLTVQGEDGTAITTGNLTGYVVKAKKTYVIEDMNSVLQGFNAGAKTRATVVATVAGPEKEIKGLYQIVNTTNMSLSNYVMVNQDSGGH